MWVTSARRHTRRRFLPTGMDLPEYCHPEYHFNVDGRATDTHHHNTAGDRTRVYLSWYRMRHAPYCIRTVILPTKADAVTRTNISVESRANCMVCAPVVESYLSVGLHGMHFP